MSPEEAAAIVAAFDKLKQEIRDAHVALTDAGAAPDGTLAERIFERLGQYDMRAGGEAEELRRLMEDHTDGEIADELRLILDIVDGRDALRFLDERDEAALTLANERAMGEPPSEGWRPVSPDNLLRTWRKEYPDGTEGFVKADGRWDRYVRGVLPAFGEDDELLPGEPPDMRASGPAQPKRHAMRACDASYEAAASSDPIGHPANGGDGPWGTS